MLNYFMDNDLKRMESIMDYNYNNETGQHPTNTQNSQKKNNYATTSLILGIVTLVVGLVSMCFLMCAPIPVITGILSIVFGFLSRQPGERISAKAVVGIVFSIVTLVLLILMVIFIITFLNSPEGQAFIQEFMLEYQDMYKTYSDFYLE